MTLPATAVILAAGRGLRLDGACGGLPKCLLEIGGRALIQRQLDCLRRLGIINIVVVVGFEAGRVAAVCGPAIRFVENPIFDRTNSLYSLWLARNELAGGFVVMNSDVLFHPALLIRLLDSNHDDALLVSLQEDNMPPLGEEEMKVRVQDGRLIDISKSMPPANAHGENVGVARFGSEGSRLFVDLMDRVIDNGGRMEWVPRVFQEFVTCRLLNVVSTAGYPWIEIDFPEDYRRAVSEVLPMICGGSMAGKSARTRHLGLR